jgi:hypothetical protein
MKTLKIMLVSAVFILAIAFPALAYEGGGGGHGGGYSGGGHGGNGAHGGEYHGGGHYGHYGGHYGWYWGPGSFWYWGWPYYYPPAYNYPYYYPPSAYYYNPPPTYYYSTPPPAEYNPPTGDVSQPPPGRSQPFIYPRQGQSQEQQAKDLPECQAWATSKTGVDPTKPPPQGLSEAQLAQKGGDFFRAFDACMDGRGYTVR